MREGGLLGWATAALVRLDDEAPGLIARTLTAAPLRRQSIFAALAAREEKVGLIGANDDLLPHSFAEVVRHGRAKDILRHGFGDVPDGLSGLLTQVGERPLPRAKDYLTLYDFLTGDDMRGAEALRASGRITCRKLEVLLALDPRWRHTHTLDRIDSGTEAITFNAAVEFVQSVCSRATDEAIAQAIAQMRPTSTLPRLLDRFVRRADRLPPHPVPAGDNELRPLTTMRDHLEAARKYRNCLASKIGQVAAGRIAIAEFRGECLLEFRPLTSSSGWMFWLCHGPRNGPVPISTLNAAAAKCDVLGIPRQDEDAGGSGWRNYRRFTQEMDWD